MQKSMDMVTNINPSKLNHPSSKLTHEPTLVPLSKMALHYIPIRLYSLIASIPLVPALDKS